MNLQRKLTLIVATGAVALGAGHVVQKRAADRLAAQQAPVIVTDVTPVAAGPESVAPTLPLPEPAAPVASLPEPVDPPETAVVDVSPPPAPAAEELAVTTPPEPVAPDCTVRFDLVPQPGAMIGLSLLAPCHPEERVVLRHAGLAVTGKTSASGALFGALPAMRPLSDVEVLFADGEKAASTITMPEAADLRRFIVQWQDEDAFQLHAFEGGAGYDGPGHYSAAFAGTAGDGAFVTLLGDSTTALPLLAEAFTFAKGKEAEIILEAEVTATTCNREILGETIMVEAGSVNIADLSLSMPGCEAIGDILVLKNLMQDMKLAAAK